MVVENKKLKNPREESDKPSRKNASQTVEKSLLYN